MHCRLTQEARLHRAASCVRTTIITKKLTCMCATTESRLAGTVIRVASIIQCRHCRGPVATHPFVYHPVVVIITITTITTIAPFTTTTRSMRIVICSTIMMVIITLMVRIDGATGLADDAERGLAGGAAGELIG